MINLLVVLLSTVACLHAQDTIPAVEGESDPISDPYTAKKIYRVQLKNDPIAIQIVEDPRYSAELIPEYEMVYLSHSPTSEIKRIPRIIDTFRLPQTWAQETYLVTDALSIKYPNTIGVLPKGAVKASSQYIWWVASGYVGPRSNFPSNIGGIYLIDMAKERWVPVALINTTGTGFTNVEWMDMDRDGLMDFVTVSGTSNMNQLAWYKQPAEQKAWEKHVISGIDYDVGGTDFKVMNLPRDGYEGTATVFVIAGRKSGRLTAYWVDDPLNDWTRETKIRQEIIGADGPYVNAEIVDINMDAKKEILVSLSAVAGKTGKVIAYEYPKDGVGSGGKWRKHILAEWAQTGTSYQTTAPGPCFSFSVKASNNRNVKPHILVSGGDDKMAYILSPTQWSPFIWTYKKTVIFSSKGSVGKPAVKDIDGDGTMEIFIPNAFGIDVLRYERGAAPRIPCHLWLLCVSIISTIMLSV